jgi:prevent-host-death family protein
MSFVNVHAAKTNFSRLLARVLAGETIVIAKGGKPIARLVPYQRATKRRIPGQDTGKIWIAPDFDAPLPKDLLCAFCPEDST